MSQLASVQLCGGSNFIHNGEVGILHGCPDEAVKFLSRAGLGGIKLLGIVAPDTFHRGGNSLASIEFPSYLTWFVPPQRPRILYAGTASQLKRFRRIMQMTLLGPTMEDYKRWQRRYPELSLSSAGTWIDLVRYFGLKHPDGKPKTLDDVVEWCELIDDAPTEVGPFTVARTHRLNSISVQIGAERIGSVLDLDAPIEPPFELPLGREANIRPRFGLEVASYGNGFFKSGGCTILIVWMEGMPYLCDSGPFALEFLRAKGISASQVPGIFLSHAHGDHDAVLSLLLTGRRPVIYAHPFVWESVLEKIAAVLGFDLEVESEDVYVRSLFDVRILVVDREQPFGPGKITIRPTVHTIPTYSARVIHDGRSILLAGDTCGPKTLAELYELGIIPSYWYDGADLSSLGNRTDDLIVLDAGSDPGGLHPQVEELQPLVKDSPGRYLFGHRGPLADGMLGNHAAPGNQYFLNPTHVDTGRLRFIEALDRLGLPRPVQLAHELWHPEHVISLPPNHVLCYRGTAAKESFLVLDGTVGVYSDNTFTKCLSLLEAGDPFGDQAVLSDQPRNAAVRTKTAAVLLRFPAKQFSEFVQRYDLLGRLRRIWENRTMLQSCAPFRYLSAEAIRRLAEAADVVRFGPGEVVVKEDELSRDLYVVKSGQLVVKRDGDESPPPNRTGVLLRSDVFGEMTALKLAPRRTASIVGVTSGELLVFTEASLRLLDVFAGAKFGLIGLVQRRKLENAVK